MNKDLKNKKFEKKDIRNILILLIFCSADNNLLTIIINFIKIIIFKIKITQFFLDELIVNRRKQHFNKVIFFYLR